MSESVLPASRRSSWLAHGRSTPWRWLIRLVLPACMLIFAVLLLTAINNLEWADIRLALSRLSVGQIGIGLALTGFTYAAASCYELLSRAQERPLLSAPICLAIGFVCYTVAASLSSLLGNWVMRYRLYARRGIGFRKATRIAVMSVSCNWSGFILLSGLVFLLAPPNLPAHWPLQESGLRVIGVLMLAATVAYLRWCGRAAGHSWQLRGIRFTVPQLHVAVLQLLVSMLVWSGTAAVVTQFLPLGAEFIVVLAVLFLSTVAGLVIRVPAGVGVTEVVFVTLLGPILGGAAVVAALLAYRVMFQLVPLILAAGVFLVLEIHVNGTRPQARSGSAKRLELPV